MFSFDSGKYKGIIISVALFLLLDASVLMMNFYISFEIADDAQGVNIAGRQRMLSQRMMKSLFDIQASSESPENLDRAVNELKNTTILFNKTLNAFAYGGETKGATGELTTLQIVSSNASSTAVNHALDLWQPYWSRIEVLLNSDFNSESFVFTQAVSSAINYGKKNNLQLLKLMNDLTVDLEQVASSKATRLRLIQTIGITLAIINFFIIMFHFLKQLRESDEKIEAAKKETDEILHTVNEGLFLLDESLAIGEQHSEAIEGIFHRKDIAGIRLDALLGDIITSNDMSTAKSFIGLLFKPTIKENLIGDLNPLNEVEVYISTESGEFKNKYLSFSFSRVLTEDTDEISHVLVTVSDVTEKVKLERELEQVQAQNEQQFQVLSKIIHTNSDLLNSYINNSFTTFNKVNQILKSEAKNQTHFLNKVKDIYALIHNYKGESAAMELDQFVDIAHQFETELDSIKSNRKIEGNDFLPLTILLNQLINHTESTQQLSEKLYQFTGKKQTEEDVEIKREISHYQSIANQICGRHDKSVEVITSGMNDLDLSEQLYTSINSIIIQLVRNSVIHGIETKESRILSQKSELGTIDIRIAKRLSGNIELNVSDDGVGIDVEHIRNLAIERNFVSAVKAEGMDSKQIISLIFEPNFSTTDEADYDSGRGMGMYAVKELVKQWAGKIAISSRSGRGTQFSISLMPEAQTDTVKKVA